jgi:CheY-like chemotaxis protein
VAVSSLPVTTPAANASAATAVTKPPDGNEVLLKFQQELVAEAKAHREFLQSIVSAILYTGTFVTIVIGGLAAFFGIREYKEIKKTIGKIARQQFNKRIDQLIVDHLNPLVDEQNDKMERTRKKLIKGTAAINDALIKSNPPAVVLLSAGLSEMVDQIRDKKILWVDDDEPGIDLYVKIVESCGAKVDFAKDTADAIAAAKKGAYSLLVTNMMRDDDPCESPAGITLAKEVLKIYTDKLPIIIFTREGYRTSWEKRATEMGVKEMCCNPQELMSAIGKYLNPTPIATPPSSIAQGIK